MSESPVYWSQPNQQVVRDGEPVGVFPDDPDPQSQGFDPADHTVGDVEAYVDEHPDELGAVLDAERAGKNRVTLVEALEAR
jgi:hypothetical protein